MGISGQEEVLQYGREYLAEGDIMTEMFPQLGEEGRERLGELIRALDELTAVEERRAEGKKVRR